MKTIRELTLTVITALFVVTVALLWASASPKVTGQTTPPLPSRHWPRPASHRTRSDCPPWTVYFKRLGEDSTPEFSVMVSARNHSLWVTWMATETSIFWSATAFLARRAFLF